MLASRYLIPLFSLFALISAETTVTSPKGGEKFSAGQTIDVAWTSTDTSGTVEIQLCHDSGNCTKAIGAARLPKTGTFKWSIDPDQFPAETYSIFLVTAPVTEYASSPPFQVVKAAVSSSTPGPSSTTSGSNSSPAGTGGTTTTGSQSSDTSAPSSDGGSNSNGAIIGGAIGAVVVVVIIAVVGFILMRKRNQKKLAEARRSMGHDDVEAGDKKSPGSSKGSGSLNGAAANGKKKSAKDEEYAPEKGLGGSSSVGIPMAELPAMQQEAVEMSADSGPGQHFFAMELDSREIPRPGSSSVRPDVDNTPTSPAPKPSMDKGEPRGVSIDGTTVNSETERPKTSGTIEQIKESSREGSSNDLTHQSGSNPTSPTPPQQPSTGGSNNGAGPSNRDSTPQIGSIPKLGGFDFDTAKF
ncbi:hypothetical protein ABW20_dc0106904 [Dactylellina cionopaga]|nr:hypothetical protein ABW20_dc0106904 [Dactylellina cionopaga]